MEVFVTIMYTLSIIGILIGTYMILWCIEDFIRKKTGTDKYKTLEEMEKEFYGNKY